MTDTDRLRSLAEAATPGPWEVQDEGQADGLSVVRLEPDLGYAAEVIWTDDADYPDEARPDLAAYIAACSPDRILALLDELGALRAVAKAAREVSLRPFGTGAIGAQIDLRAALVRLEVTK